MSELRLSKKIREITAPGCGFKMIEEEDGMIIEIIPVQDSTKGTTCYPVFDMFDNLVKCKAIDCGAGCRICTIEYPDGYYEYYCKCGPCPKPEGGEADNRTELILSQKIKEITVTGCGFRMNEYEDGMVIEILPPKEKGAGGICSSVFDIWGNLIKCKAVDCGAGCRMCTYEYEDGYFEYYCKCGPCPKKEDL